MCFFFFFFFSSRRRHTRFDCDWSSDVCSSDLIRRTAALQDKAMEETFAAVKAGMRELEVAAVAEHVGHRYGSEQGLFLAGSGPVGTAAVFANRYQQNRVL